MTRVLFALGCVLTMAAISFAAEVDADKPQVSFSEPRFTSAGKASMGAVEAGAELKAVIRIEGDYVGNALYTGPREVVTTLKTDSIEVESQDVDLGQLTGFDKLGVMKIEFLIADRQRPRVQVRHRRLGGVVDLKVERQVDRSSSFTFRGASYRDFCVAASGRLVSRTLIQIGRIAPDLDIATEKLTSVYVSRLRVNKASLDAINRIELPEWSGFSTADEDDQHRWEAYRLRALTQEEGRAAINFRYVRSIAQALARLEIVATGTSASGAKASALAEYRRQFKEIFQKANAELTRAQEIYAAQTGLIDCD